MQLDHPTVWNPLIKGFRIADSFTNRIGRVFTAIEGSMRGERDSALNISTNIEDIHAQSTNPSYCSCWRVESI